MIGVVEEFDSSVALLQRDYGFDHRPMYYCRKNSISGAPSVDVLSKAARKALAARNVLDDAVHFYHRGGYFLRSDAAGD